MTRPPILVVEDDTILREVVAITLQTSGFKVILAGTGAEALAHIAESSPFAGLYTDIRLPGLVDGWAVGAEFYERWPTKPIVYASGREYPAELVARHPGMFLRKPFDALTLRRLSSPSIWTVSKPLPARILSTQ